MIFLYINNLLSDSECCYSALFAHYINVFILGENINALCKKLNAEW